VSESGYHALVVIVLVAAYVAVTLHGDDGNGLLGALGGYIGGVGVTKTAQPPRGSV